MDSPGAATERLLRLAVCPRCGAGLVRDVEAARCSGCDASYPLNAGCLDLRTGQAGRPSYDPDYYETLARVERRHFWFVARRERILRELRRSVPDLHARPIVDIGSGTGALLEFLAHAGLTVAAACDAYPQSMGLVRERVAVPTLLVDEGTPPPFVSGQRLVTLFDVLEHVDDDAGLLAGIRDALEPGGYVALTVPAHPLLFDEMDHMAHHRRRYSRSGLRRRLEGAGLEIRALLFFMSPLVPLLLLSRLVGRVLLGGRHERTRRSRLDFALVPGVNALLLTLLRVEGWLARVIPLPFGTSLLAVARRPRDARGAVGEGA